MRLVKRHDKAPQTGLMVAGVAIGGKRKRTTEWDYWAKEKILIAPVQLRRGFTFS